MSIPPVSAPPKFDPTWNYLPRMLLFYVLPLALLAGFLYQGRVPEYRDVLVPLLFAATVPLVNIKRKIWAFKDFQNRDCFIWTIPLLFVLFWQAALQLSGQTFWAAPLFVLLCLLYDYLLLKYELLKLYGQRVERLQQGFVRKALPQLLGWWIYIGSALYLVHTYANDSVAAMVLCGAAMIIPALSLLVFCANKYQRPQRLQGIQRVAVIGAGFSGVYATKWLVAKGLQVDCFEKSDSPGGVWHYDDKVTDRGAVFKHTRATSSKHFMHAMDFAVPDAFPDFPSHQQYMQFLEQYIDHFAIRDKIQLQTQVDSVQKTAGRWRVITTHATQQHSDDYDAVVVCAGPQGIPRIDTCSHPLYSRFSGDIIHAAAYKDSSQLREAKRILIVGAGESSADIVSECAQENAEIYWSVHHGQWFADRNIGPFAADHVVGFGLRQLLGRFLNFEYKMRRFMIQANINMIWGSCGHGIPEWISPAIYLHQFLNKSRDGIREVYRGRVTAKRCVESIDGRMVRFQGEDEAVEFDTIILATGFRPHWPFLNEPPARLYQRVFCPEDPTLAFAGLARPVLGSITSLAEIQSRWIASVYAGETTLPAHNLRESIVFENRKDHQKRFLDSSALQVLTDQIAYTEELAREMNIHLRWGRLLCTRPASFLLLLKSPWLACQFEVCQADKQRSTRALQTIRQEMPDSKHPVFLFQKILLMWCSIALIGAGVMIYFCSPWQVCALLALYLTLTAVRNRWMDLRWMRGKG